MRWSLRSMYMLMGGCSCYLRLRPFYGDSGVGGWRSRPLGFHSLGLIVEQKIQVWRLGLSLLAFRPSLASVDIVGGSD
jgi:hypothetical protein